MAPITPAWRDKSPHLHVGRIWEVADGVARIRLEGTKWFLFCSRLGILGLPIQAVDPDEAKAEALRHLAKTLTELNTRLGFLLAP